MIRPLITGLSPELQALGRLLGEAEALAMRCTLEQARLACAEGVRRRLLAQHRHEAAHHALFSALLRGAAPADSRLERALDALGAYGRKLQAALERGDLAASVVGLQVVLEGIGTQLLRAYEGPPALKPLCRVLLAQENAHHRLGLQLLASFHWDQLQGALQDYHAEGQRVLEAAQPLLARAGVSELPRRMDGAPPGA